MVELRYTGKHQAEGHKVDVSAEKAEELLRTGEYERVGFPAVYPDTSWTEKRIKEWLELNQIPIPYDVQKERKEDKLRQIEDYFEKG